MSHSAHQVHRLEIQIPDARTWGKVYGGIVKAGNYVNGRERPYGQTFARYLMEEMREREIAACLKSDIPEDNLPRADIPLTAGAQRMIGNLWAEQVANIPHGIAGDRLTDQRLSDMRFGSPDQILIDAFDAIRQQQLDLVRAVLSFSPDQQGPELVRIEVRHPIVPGFSKSGSLDLEAAMQRRREDWEQGRRQAETGGGLRILNQYVAQCVEATRKRLAETHLAESCAASIQYSGLKVVEEPTEQPRTRTIYAEITSPQAA